MDIADPEIADCMLRAALDAGDAVLEIRASGRLNARQKMDGSPVTAADIASHQAIEERLASSAPSIPLVSEEEAPPKLKQGEAYFLADPLDGTRGFLAGGDEYTVNIALMRGGKPALGVVYAPALDLCCWCDGRGGALGTDVRLPKRLDSGLWQKNCQNPLALVSRTQQDPATTAWLDGRGIVDRKTVGSSLKFALLAAGQAALYPRMASFWDWDAAAGHAVLAAAGGQVVDAKSAAPLTYGPPPCRIGGIVACARGFDP